jgi:subtilisin family serine protease
MKRDGRFLANTRRATSLGLVLCVFIGFTQSGRTSARVGVPQREKRAEDHKLSPDLRDRLRSTRASKLEPGEASRRAEDRVRVILQFRHNERGRIDALLDEESISRVDELRSFNSSVVELPVSRLRHIAASEDVAYISLDRELQTLGHIENETGIREMRLSNGNSGIEGKDIGIAIVDSGIYKGHHSLGGRIEVKLDFTGQGILEEDPYGHGTHVAAMAAASDHVVHGAYSGPAIASKIMNLRVLDSQGNGLSSNLLRALNWILAPTDPNKPLGEKNST